MKSMNLREYIAAYSTIYDQEIDTKNIDMKYLLRFWQEKRKNFNFIRKKIPIEITKSTEQIAAEISNNYELRHHKRIILHNCPFWNWELDYTLEKALAANTIDKEITIGDKVFPKGTKVMKVFRKMAEIQNKLDSYEKLRIEHSKILNDKKLCGNLVLSIHPIDFMTMSDNANNWSSCMSWVEKGDYRCGTVEMMNSPYVVVAYLESENTKFAGMPSKIWRKLFIVHPDIVCGIKGYPYENEELDEIILQELAPNNFKRTIFLENNDFLFTNEIGIKFSPSTNSMYNDFYSKGKIVAYIPDYPKSIIQVNYSGPRICMCCGKKIKDHEMKLLLCEDCERVYFCECCDHILLDNCEIDCGLCYDCQEEEEDYYD